MMFSFSALGSLGRLGNQMFQYAALKGLAAYHQVPYNLPSNTLLQQCFQVPKVGQEVVEPQIIERFYEFDDELFFHSQGDLCGYFQSEKYFSYIESEIRKDFTFCDIIKKPCYHYHKYNLSKEVVALHIRRGDYLTDPNFILLDLDYYNQALDYFSQSEVIILSDDIGWCKEHFKGNRFKFSLSNNQFIDLCLMSLCDYHIISNSSFSWWGSWLAKSKKTIAPSKWFTGNYSHWDTKDLYRKDWIIL